jgi:hypothetical protein
MGGSMGKLLGLILGMLTIVVTLAIAPSIETANAAVQSANLTNLIGMAVLDDFGAPLAIIGLLTLGGLFTIGAWKSSVKMNDMLQVVITAVIVIVGLTFMTSIITYTNTLIGSAVSGFGDTLYGIIPLFVYLAIIGISGWQSYKAVGRIRGGKKSAGATF